MSRSLRAHDSGRVPDRRIACAQEQRVRAEVVGVAKRLEEVQTDIAQRFERLEALLKKEG